VSALAILVGLFAAIFFHEAAHFAAAKAFGMKVTEFFAGFGPRLWSFRRGETEYGIKLFVPLGGYVKITGMSPIEEVDPDEEHRTYRGSVFWKKSVVVLAGVGANFVLAFLIFYFVHAAIGVPETEARVGTVIQELDDGTPTPASLSDLEPGDLILSVDGVEVEYWGDLLGELKDKADVQLVLVVQRDGSTFNTALTPALRDERGFVGIGIPDPVTRTFGPSEAFTRTVDIYWQSIEASVRAVGSLLWPPNLIDLFGDAVEGTDPGNRRPVTVVGLVGESSNIFEAAGWAGILSLIAGLNIIVGLFNVLPLFPLDGGHFAVAAYEKLRGKPVDVEKLVPLAVGVIMFFVSIFLLGLWFDLFGPGLDFG
jgi:membrane-associated protease RseP (regulator of RpoE activity)